MNMINQKIISLLGKLTGHKYIQITTRGNTAIQAAVSLIPVEQTILIPEEGGWLSYQEIKNKEEVKCDDAKINLNDLKQKLSGEFPYKIARKISEKISKRKVWAFLYQNPGGYFAAQPIKEIYEICHKNNCLVIIDVSGAIGTKMENGRYADILVGSFGKWKLVEARAGGFVSCNDKNLLEKMEVKKLTDESKLKIILEKLNQLPERINFLSAKREQIIQDLADFSLLHPQDIGFVVIVKFSSTEEKQKIIDYCLKNNFPYRECPRYIRLNKPAISIEVKQLIPAQQQLS